MTTVVVRDYAHRHQRQLVPSDKYGKYNCTAYAAAMAFDAATVGGMIVSGREVRALSTEPIPDPASPGLNLKQIVAVARKLHASFTDRTLGGWVEVISSLQTGRRIVAQVDHLSLGAYKCQSTGDFGHAMMLYAWKIDKKSKQELIAGADPLCPAGKWYPASIVHTAMATFAHESGLTGDHLRFGVTRIVPRIAVET